MGSSDPRPAARLHRSDWATGADVWRGRFEGQDLGGTSVSVIFFATDELGAGPVLHVHPYDEVFIVREGRALFTVGAEAIEAERGDVILGPAHVPHKFANLGPGRLETTDIHLSARVIQTDLAENT